MRQANVLNFVSPAISSPRDEAREIVPDQRKSAGFALSQGQRRRIPALSSAIYDTLSQLPKSFTLGGQQGRSISRSLL